MASLNKEEIWISLERKETLILTTAAPEEKQVKKRVSGEEVVPALPHAGLGVPVCCQPQRWAAHDLLDLLTVVREDSSL